MWKKINYKPEEIEIASAFDDHGENESDQIGISQSHQQSDTLTPPSQKIDPSRYGGICLRKFQEMKILVI